MTFAHRHSSETGLLFSQVVKMSGQIADKQARIDSGGKRLNEQSSKVIGKKVNWISRCIRL
jgi:hypothetical protein